MHDIKHLRHNAADFDTALAKRGLAPVSAALLALDEQRRGLQTQLQDLQQQRNVTAKAAGAAKGRGDEAEFARLNADASANKQRTAQLEAAEAIVAQQLQHHLETLPNLPQHDVPHGRDENDNVQINAWGTPRVFDFTPKPHEDVAGQGLNFNRAAQVSGARFVYAMGAMARLERALTQFMLDLHTQEFGYTEVSPPYLVRDNALYGTGQLPKFGEDLFAVDGGYRLIPTAEVPLTNLVADTIVPAEQLPLRYTAATPCFRSEAGSAGRDTTGIIRMHQFSKVELVSVTTPQQSADELERMTRCAQTVLEKLELPYRTMLLCSGDMGFSAQKTYDIEVWFPAQNRYREISSCSNCGSFQALRLKARTRVDGHKDTVPVHTLNGSALAVGRTLAALLENHQQADGTVAIPQALQGYMGGAQTIAVA